MNKLTSLSRHVRPHVNKPTLAGLFTLALFLLGAGTSMNYSTYHLYKNLDPIALTTCASFVSAAAALSSFLRDKSVSSPPTAPGGMLKHYSLATLYSFITWTSGYTAIYYINPAAFSAIAISMGPIIIALMNIKTLRGMNLIAALLAVATVLMLSTSHGSGLQCTLHDDYQLEFGVTLSMLCGISFYLGTRTSKQLNDFGRSSLKVNAFRSTLTFVICATIGFSDGAFNAMLTHIDQLGVFSFFFIFLTQVALLLSIKAVGTHAVAVALSAVPLCTLLLQVVLFQLRVDSFMAFMVAGNALALIFVSHLQASSALAKRTVSE